VFATASVSLTGIAAVDFAHGALPRVGLHRLCFPDADMTHRAGKPAKAR
jgi:hypothetical protein